MGKGFRALWATLALLALPAAAHASTISTSTNPSEDLFQAGSGDEISMLVYVDFDPAFSDNAVYFLPTDSTVPDPTTTDANCVSRSAGASSCAIRNTTRIMGDTANDFVNVGAAGSVVEFHGGAGNDRIFSTASRVVAYGDANNDDLAGSTNATAFNQLYGGTGDDKLTVYAQFDTVSGGDGFDTLNTTGGPTGVTITLDGAANDGKPGQTQNIGVDVEHVVGLDGNDQIAGNANANTLDGGNGNDTLTTNGGNDTLNGGGNDDTLQAHDGDPDTVNCGTGTDHAFVDPVDMVAADCETVTYSDDDHDGFPADVDCNDHAASVHPGAVDTPGDGVDQDCSGGDVPLPIVDLDHDGSVPPADCNDHNAAIKPGAADVPGNGVDENCDGHDAAFPVLDLPVTNRWLAGKTTKVVQLEVKNVPAGATVKVKCKGKSCPFKSKTATVKAGTAKLTKLFKHRKLKPGVKIEISITKPATVGKFVRFTILKKKLPKVQALCLPPGSTSPKQHC
jgi:hypothetical protein